MKLLRQRFAPFRDERRRQRRRRIVGGLVIAGIVLTGVSTGASAYSPAPVSDNDLSSSISALLLAAHPLDYSPRDMVVAAPSSVIGSTMTETPNTTAPETPTRQVQDVNRWRPNPQSWIDAKSRAARPTGVTTANWERAIARTARWQPRITPPSGLSQGGTTLLRRSAGGAPAAVAFQLLGGLLVPSVETLTDQEGIVDSYWCSERAAGRIELIGFLVTGDCAGWEADQDAAVELRAVMESLQGKELCVPGGGCYHLKRVTNAFIEFTSQNGFEPAATARKAGQICFTRSGTGFGSYKLVAQLSRPDGGSSFVDETVNGGSWNPDRCEYLTGDAYRAFVSPYQWTSGYASIQSLQLVHRVTGEVAEQVSAESGRAEWITRVKCLDGSFRYAVSDPFDFEQGGMMPEPAAVDLEGCDPVSVDVGIQDEGTGTSWDPSRSVGGGEVPDEVQDWQRDFPQCWDGSCRLLLKKVVGDKELDCFDVPDQCVDWSTESKTDPTRYKCYYAGQPVPLAECTVYQRVFDRDRVQDGDGYSDPDGGDTTTRTNLGAAREAMNTPVQDPSKSRNCWPQGWAAFNPFEWVFQPVRCAMEWAFVPKPAKLTQVRTKIKLAVDNSKPVQFARTLRTWGTYAEAVNPSGCLGPALDLNLMGIQYSGHPLQACTEPTATLAFWSRIIIGAGVIIAGLFAVTRYVGRVFGFDGFGRSSGGDS